MRPSALLSCLLCLVLQKAAGQAPDTFYMVMLPAEIHHPTEERVCIHLCGITELVQFTITLQTESRDTKLMEMSTEGPDLHECRPFKVPPPSGGVEEVAAIQFWLSGNHTNFHEVKQVLITATEKIGIIQTDKPVYSPGETVQIRATCMDENFMSGNDVYPLVVVMDPHGYRIGQWKDMSPRQGVVGMNFTLASEVTPGTYTVKIAHLRSTQTFLVTKDVMPKFEVLNMLPSVVTLEDEAFTFKVCGRYTSGRPVSGYIQGTVCHPAAEFFWYDEQQVDNCKEFHGQTDKSGCLARDVQTKDFDLASYEYQANFKVHASLTEAGTEVTINSTEKCAISPFISTVTFEESGMDTFYKPGIKYRGAMQILRADGTAMKREKVYLTIEYGWISTERNYTTNDAGRAFFVLDSSAWNGSPVKLKAQYKKEKPDIIYGQRNPVHMDASMTLYMFNSLVNSFLKIQPPEETLACDQEYSMGVDYNVRSSDILEDDFNINLHYIIMAKGNIQKHGQTRMNVRADTETKGTLYIPIPVSSDIAPQARILVYSILTKGRVMADTAEFPVSMCFKNKAQMSFSQYEALPGSNVSLRIQAAPGSLCNIRAVDASVTFVRPEAEITPASVYQLVAPKNPVGYPWPVQEQDTSCWLRPRTSRSIPGHSIQKRFDPVVVQPMQQTDFFTLIRRASIKALTNCQIKKPPQCSRQRNRPRVAKLGIGQDGEDHRSVLMDDAQPDTVEFFDLDFDIPESKVEKKNEIRRHFQQTWLFNQIQLNLSGTTEMSLTIPDTITEWRTMMFCTSAVGFGLSSTQSIKAFKPFYTDLMLPSSAIRGETFTIKARVFNYLKNPIQVKMTLTLPETEQEDAGPGQFAVRPCPDCIYTRCLEADTSATFHWLAVATILGEAPIQIGAETLDSEELCGGEKTVVPFEGATDTVIRSILVEAEGLLVENSYNTLLCAKGNLSSEVISAKCPPDAVKGSESARISLVGDMMGKPLENLEYLVLTPAGSGEQTISKLLTLTHLHQYLEETEQKTKLSKKLNELMNRGTTRLLNYKRGDGSFSAFGERDAKGNTWLSAAAMNLLHRLSTFVAVDPKITEECLSWLADTQLPSGCFQPSGKPFKSSLMDEPNDKISVTAYVTVKLLEIEDLLNHPVVVNALKCLRNVTNEVVGTHTRATLAYVYTLSGDDEPRALMLKKLYTEAEISEGNVFWRLTPRTLNKASGWFGPNQGEVETTALILQAHLSQKNLAKDDIKMASQLAALITHHQNPYGGYSTCQETAEAFKALAKYAATTYSGHHGINVTLTSPEGFRHVFPVNESSRLLLQQVQLPHVPGEYQVDVEGDGCVYVQVTVSYHDPYPVKKPGFSLRVDSVPKDCNIYSCRDFTIHIQTSYEGPDNTSNMALIEVGLPSGFSADTESLNEMEKFPLVRKTEITAQKVLIYLDYVNNQPQNINFMITEDNEVLDRKNSTVKISDLYTVDYSATAVYAVIKP